MYKMILLAALLSLVGCASTTDKTAEAETAPVASTPGPASESAPATAAVDKEPAAQPASQAAAAPSGWDELSQRMLAWGDPMRRSMEQYCLPQNTTSNP